MVIINAAFSSFCSFHSPPSLPILETRPLDHIRHPFFVYYFHFTALSSSLRPRCQSPCLLQNVRSALIPPDLGSALHTARFLHATRVLSLCGHPEHPAPRPCPPMLSFLCPVRRAEARRRGLRFVKTRSLTTWIRLRSRSFRINGEAE